MKSINKSAISHEQVEMITVILFNDNIIRFRIEDPEVETFYCMLHADKKPSEEALTMINRIIRSPYYIKWGGYIN